MSNSVVIEEPNKFHITISEEGVRWKHYSEVALFDMEGRKQCESEWRLTTSEFLSENVDSTTEHISSETSPPQHIYAGLDEPRVILLTSDMWVPWLDVVRIGVKAPDRWHEAFYGYRSPILKKEEPSYQEQKNTWLKAKENFYLSVELILHSDKLHQASLCPLTLEQSEKFMDAALPFFIAYKENKK